MYRAKKPLLSDLNAHLICKLCKGYFVDATTVIECLHTFCRSCIVKYLETTKYCPICDVQVHKSKPLLSLRPDKIIQDVVYKLVPRLHQNELRRRKEFHKRHSDKLSTTEENFEASCALFTSPEEELSVTLTYYGSLGKPRYLRCPSAVSVMVLQKLIRAKFDLPDSHHVDILHNQDCLNPCYTLMDILYIYKLSKLETLDLTYRIYEYMAKKIKLENQDCKNDNQTNITLQPPMSNNNNWKEVQLRISENGEMSITGIQDDITSQSFSKEMIEVLETKPKSPIMGSVVNAVKKKDLPELKIVKKAPQSSKCINIISDTIIRPYSMDTRLNDCLPSSAGNKGICNVMTSVTVPSSMTTVLTTVNSTKCSVGTTDSKSENNSAESLVGDVRKEPQKERVENPKEIKETNENPLAKGIKRKFDDLRNEDSKMPTEAGDDKADSKTLLSEVLDINIPIQPLDVKNDSKKLEETSCSDNKEESKSSSEPPMTSDIPEKKSNSVETAEKPKVQNDGKFSMNQSNAKTTTTSRDHVTNNSNSNNNHSKQVEDMEKNSISSNPTPPAPKPSTKYQGASQPCYMPKTSFNSVLNVPKMHQSTNVKNEAKTSLKMVSTVKNEVKANSSGSGPISNPTNNSSSVTKQKLSTKVKSNSPMGYKTLKDPPKSWNSQISKANLNKAQPDAKYSDLKNVRPAKFFKMRNNMLRFLGNPASGVKPMYSVHANSEQEKPQEKVVENREIKKHSIVKIDPKTLKPISEKAPETTSLSSQVSTTADLKINTSSVSIFNPLKLQSNSPKSDRKSPKSPQSPRHKSSPSPSPPVLKRDKPNLNFTPPNPFIPNLSSQTVNPNQFLCNTGPPAFPSYDPRMMAAYHNLFYGPSMGFPPNPLSYHLGGLDIAQRGKGFDISKIVGMQQQASSSKGPSSPQSTSKLDVPIVPPQVPYQPRPNPMSSRTSNLTPVSKRSLKDLTKNEKSLQNTVEKLTLSRAKEIHRAAEALSKLTSAEVKRGDNNRNNEGEKKVANHRDGNGAIGTQPTGGVEAKENRTETKTSQDKTKEEIRKREGQIECTSNEQKDAKTSSKSANSDKTSAKTEPKTKNESSSSNKPVETPEKDGREKFCETRTDSKPNPGTVLKRDNVDNIENDLGSQVIADQPKCVNNTDNTLKTSDDKRTNDNVNEADNNAGSEKLDGLAGNK